jgi:hypothetical protein
LQKLRSRKNFLAWEKVGGVAGVDLKTATGEYFSRYRLNGKRTFRRLESDILTVATLRHQQCHAETEKDRQRGPTISKDFQTLGELANDVVTRINMSDRKPGSKRLRRTKLLAFVKTGSAAHSIPSMPVMSRPRS